MDHVARLVRRIVRQYRTNDPFAICTQRDIDIKYVALGSLSGAYTENYRSKVILINSELSEEQQHVTCIHELGHILLRHKQNKLFLSKCTLYRQSKPELEADIFTALMLTAGFDEELKLTAEQAADITKVNLDLVLQSGRT